MSHRDKKLRKLKKRLEELKEQQKTLDTETNPDINREIERLDKEIQSLQFESETDDKSELTDDFETSVSSKLPTDSTNLEDTATSFLSQQEQPNKGKESINKEEFEASISSTTINNIEDKKRELRQVSNKDQIFISYCWDNYDFAKRLTEDLSKENRFNIWLDKFNLLPGEKLSSTIQKAINQSKHFIVILSPEFIESDFAEDEYTFAAKIRKTTGLNIIPVLYKDIPETAIPMRLTKYKYVDFRNQDNYERNFQELLITITDDSSNTPSQTHLISEKTWLDKFKNLVQVALKRLKSVLGNPIWQGIGGAATVFSLCIACIALLRAFSTPTETPVPPTATASSTPTETPVPPTATASSTSTETPVPPTATASSTSTETPVPPAVTASSTPTETPVPPTATASSTSTETPVPPTATASSTSTETPVPPAATTTATSPPTIGIPGSDFSSLRITNADEENRIYGNSEAIFEWRWDGQLAAGQGFEVRAWREGEQPLGVHNAQLDNKEGNIQLVTDNIYRLKMDITNAAGVNGRSGDYKWTVLLIQWDPEYKELGIQATPVSFRFEMPGSSSNNQPSGNGQPPGRSD